MNICKVIALLTVTVTVMLCGCSKDLDEMLPVTSIIDGKVTVSNMQGSQSLKQNQTIMQKDTLTVPVYAKVSLNTPDGGSIYLNSMTKTIFGKLIKQNDGYLQQIYLLEGELYFFRNHNRAHKIDYVFVTACGNVRATSSGMYLKFDQEMQVVSLYTLGDPVEFISTSDEKKSIPSCYGFYMTSQSDLQIYPLTDTDVGSIRRWVGDKVIDEIANAAGCSPVVIETGNLPPEWSRFPSEICSAGELYIDTISATDPENSIVKYSLVSAPEGMILDSISGVFRYKATAAGNYVVHVKAQDPEENSTEYEFSLNVSSELAVKLFAPLIVNPKQNFTISASPVDKTGGDEQYTYRFDCDGDGKYDFPAKNAFSKKSSVKNCSFTKEGTYRISVEIKNGEGKTAVASRKILVAPPPVASLKITPLSGAVGTKFLLDASGSNSSKDTILQIRFDLNGDGIWDLPANGGFFNEKTVSYIWAKPGKYSVKLQVKNSLGQQDTASAVVTVTKGLVAPEIVSLDTVHVTDSIAFKCKTGETEFAIVKYEWSFDNDSVFEVQSTKPLVKKSFTQAGDVLILCRITDEKGLSVVQKKRIIVINASSIVKAGGPYKTGVNIALTVEGIAEDKDSKIVGYYWDFDGDGNYDWTSDKNGKTSYTFTRAGNKKIVFTVKTEDGQTASDTALVTVTNMAPKVTIGDDIMAKSGRKIKFNGNAEDPDGKIALYEWDFDGDGTVDFSSTENGFAEHEFEKYSRVILTVTDSDGAKASDSLNVIICPDGMETVEKGKYCIDTYEYPNKKGTEPLLNVTYQEARELCAKQGKHLCSSQEWEYACNESDEKNIYPYGKTFIQDNCNTLGNRIVKNKVSVSGAFSHCRSSLGVYDMSGNAAEWIESNEKTPVVRGGSWQNNESDGKCTSKFQLQGGKKYFYVGFRCCK